jgi:hypothetical protein
MSTPSTPSAGYVDLYAKTDRRIYTKDQDGTELVVASGQAGQFQPGDQGLIAWTHDPLIVFNNTTNAITAGVVYLMAIVVPVAATVTNLYTALNSQTTPAGLTNSFAGIYSTAGTRLAVTNNVSTPWQSIGLSTLPLSSTYAITPGRYYIGIVVGGATTVPTFSRSGGTFGSSPVYNVGGTAASANFRCGSILTGQTSLPTSITMASVTTGPLNYWVGMN